MMITWIIIALKLKEKEESNKLPACTYKVRTKSQDGRIFFGNEAFAITMFQTKVIGF